MSTFCGIMWEYPFISIDRFDALNLKSQLYFLSHFHKDHTVGLLAQKFVDRLKHGRGQHLLYCSKITEILLLSDSRYSHLKDYIVSLPLDEPVLLSASLDGQTTQFNVTLLSADHCLGSVMFLFEGKNGHVLYTGDFRWSVGEVSTKVPLHIEEKIPKTIDAIYVDTTFCFPEAFHIPPRAECDEATILLCKEWINFSSDHTILISSKVRYGHENLLASIARHLGVKIHVSPEMVKLYASIDGLEDVFTSDLDCQIHACSGSICSRLKNVEKGHLRIIRPSTMWFVMQTTAQKAVVNTPHVVRVCYCFHSSYSEVRDLISYLNPRRVYPNVIPPSHRTVDKVQTILTSFLNHRGRTSPHQLGTLKLSKGVKLIDSPSKSLNLSFDTQEVSHPSPSVGSNGIVNDDSCVKSVVNSLCQSISIGNESNQTHLSSISHQSQEIGVLLSQSYAGSAYNSSERNSIELSDFDLDQSDHNSPLCYLSGDSDDEEYVDFLKSQDGRYCGRSQLTLDGSRSNTELSSKSNSCIRIHEMQCCGEEILNNLSEADHKSSSSSPVGENLMLGNRSNCNSNLMSDKTPKQNEVLKPSQSHNILSTERHDQHSLIFNPQRRDCVQVAAAKENVYGKEISGSSGSSNIDVEHHSPKEKINQSDVKSNSTQIIAFDNNDIEKIASYSESDATRRLLSNVADYTALHSDEIDDVLACVDKILSLCESLNDDNKALCTEIPTPTISNSSTSNTSCNVLRETTTQSGDYHIIDECDLPETVIIKPSITKAVKKFEKTNAGGDNVDNSSSYTDLDDNSIITISSTSNSSSKRHLSVKRKISCSSRKMNNKRSRVSLSSESSTDSELVLIQSKNSLDNILQRVPGNPDKTEQTRRWCETHGNHVHRKRRSSTKIETADDGGSSGFVDLTHDSDSDCFMYS